MLIFQKRQHHLVRGHSHRKSNQGIVRARGKGRSRSLDWVVVRKSLRAQVLRRSKALVLLRQHWEFKDKHSKSNTRAAGMSSSAFSDCASNELQPSSSRI